MECIKGLVHGKRIINSSITNTSIEIFLSCGGFVVALSCIEVVLLIFVR